MKIKNERKNDEKIIVCLISFSIYDVRSAGCNRRKDTTDTKIIVSEDVNDCINKIHDNPAVIKLLIRNLAKDKDKMREVYREIINDPDMVELINEIRNNFRADEKMRKQEKQY